MDWFNVLKGLFERGKIDEEKLDNAVSKNLITEDDKKTIINIII